MKAALLTTVVAATTVHEDRLAQIATIQKTPGVTWTAGVNARFAKHAPGASASLNGVKAGWKERIASRIASGAIVKKQRGLLGGAAIPDSFDSETQWPQCAKMIGDIRDQSNCGCCWAFAGAEAASDRMCIATNATLMVPLSAQDVCFCGSDDGCSGGFVEETLDYIRVHGAVTGGQYQGTGPFGKGMCADFSLPHCHHHGPQGNDPFPAEGEDGCPSASSPQCPTKCGAEASDAHKDFASDKYSFDGKSEGAEGELAIQQMIMNGGPVETAFTVYADFEDYSSGVYQHVTGDEAGGHAVKIVGWGVDSGTKYWKIANSWNLYWGEKGYFRILRGENHCGIEDYAVGAEATATWHNSVTPSTECGDQETQSDCESLTCKWCYIQLFHTGFCLKPDSTACDDSSVSV